MKHFSSILLVPFAVLSLFLSACSPKSIHAVLMPPMGMNWQAVDSLNEGLPPEVRVFRGENTSLPLRAWYVRIKESSPAIYSRVVMSDDAADRRETASSFAKDLNACVVLNGGYFTMNKAPADHVGLLMADGKVLFDATGSIEKGGVKYEASRAALGITADDRVEIGWATTKEGKVYRWRKPLFNFLKMPTTNPNYAEAEVWNVRDAMGAGPMILVNNEIRRYWIEELFFGTSIPAVHPRSAMGLTREGDVILMVVDGRQPESRGVSLEELAALMQSAGAVRALNLDGGGSSAMVVNGKRLNRPGGGNIEREVVSAFAVFCK